MVTVVPGTVAREAPPVLTLKKNHIRVAALAVSCGVIAGFTVPTWTIPIIVIAVILGLYRWRIALIVAVAFGIGAIRGMTSIAGALPDVNEDLRGVVLEEPTAALRSAVLRLDNGRMVTVYGSYVASIRFGDEIGFRCTEWSWVTRFEKPRCRVSDVNTFARGRAGTLRAVLYNTKSWFESSIRRTLPNPEAPLLSGLLLGSRDEIPYELKQDFRISGTSHIVAVSGFNVTIVVALIASMLRYLPIPRGARLSLTCAAIAGFVMLTGSSPSVVRAGIMGSLVVLGRETGRLADALHTLMVSVTVMVVADPAIIASIGFQLSVAATLGLVLLSSRFEKLLSHIPSLFGIRSSLGTTLAAVVVTQPLITLYFGQISVVAPITNLIILPLIPIAMLVGFCVISLSAIVPMIAVYIGWIAWAPLTAIIRAVELCARLPFASVRMGMNTSIAISVIWAAMVAYAFIQVRKIHEAP
ncbi:MAG: ComEC/Rec2 family competence protein [Candidatus Kerfeldbacteria bacterium]